MCVVGLLLMVLDLSRHSLECRPTSRYQDFSFVVSGGAETSDVLPGINTFHSDHDKGRPYFDVVGRRNVTAVVGQTARLNCRVKNLGDQQFHIFFNYKMLHLSMLDFKLS
ncbi:hypothetical protein Ocin01_01466 [Orchesella cincta]|uniref:Uncharacterized protein n=1 Tax=Orchesella cincta TaxID=48709 RepID=A0A1D2NIW8_ORCCI|nr:hypothetical protein Ocin01_01466 [Orchesella cincta]